MPTYTVQLRVNVAGLGERAVTQTGIIAANIAAAIVEAQKAVTVETTAVQKTAD